MPMTSRPLALLCCLALCADTVDAFKPARLRPRVARFLKSRRVAPLPDEVMAVYNSRFVPLGQQQQAAGTVQRSKAPSSTVQSEDVLALWTALVEAYGTDELALTATRRNPTLLSPLYSRPAKIAESKVALLEVFDGSEADVSEVLLQNPALLQCGKGLLMQRPEEIRSALALAAVERSRTDRRSSRNQLHRCQAPRSCRPRLHDLRRCVRESLSS